MPNETAKRHGIDLDAWIHGSQAKAARWIIFYKHSIADLA